MKKLAALFILPMLAVFAVPTEIPQELVPAVTPEMREFTNFRAGLTCVCPQVGFGKRFHEIERMKGFDVSARLMVLPIRPFWPIPIGRIAWLSYEKPLVESKYFGYGFETAFLPYPIPNMQLIWGKEYASGRRFSEFNLNLMPAVLIVGGLILYMDSGGGSWDRLGGAIGIAAGATTLFTYTIGF
ncbi:MAG: hypothetical protein SP1CHLAM54_11410 [Chlamydiia bacterium]|nr:hypothetical protein [Chlamydiia bacterium]MCH9616044.1 hypothetical protein [Chlamydiia bacterium]MCH9629067.1 hypothetical protein [Chlamydiia bacterium]